MSLKIKMEITASERTPDEMAIDLRRLADAVEAKDLNTLPSSFSFGPRPMSISLTTSIGK